jgi:ATP-dependent exoDNAse (exonuclease V) beta subunit
MQSRGLSDNKHLVVYRASAGSGKTHRLTGEFLQLLFSSPAAYRHILAVTFTNKATDEMKSRIIEELASLASGKKSDYLNDLMTMRMKNEVQIREQARQTLVGILHDYSAFSISTIDRFFQQTMRAFTREIGVGGYNIELDSAKVLQEAIDSMLYDLERKENKQLLNWLLRFSEEKIESGDTWNIRYDIQTLASELFKENYKAFSGRLQQEIANDLEAYKDMLLSFIRNFENNVRQSAEKGLNIMSRYGLAPDDFKGESRSPFFQLVKWANGEFKEPKATFGNLADNIENWYTGKTDAAVRGNIENAYRNGLNDCVLDIVGCYRNNMHYQTACEINRYYFTLGILSDVDKKIREYAAENNLMLISDTTELLNKIIAGCDAPFIYEKTGTYIENYMIDEFQDTSSMQWANFRPLIQDSIASGRSNLIVGDVKQSIYRWRNSDWKLLEEELDRDFGEKNILHKSLDTNWRSLSNIVDFNNTVFTVSSRLLQDEFNEALPADGGNALIAANRLSEKIAVAYSGVYQQVPASKSRSGGHVRIEFIDTEEHADWEAYSLEQLPKTVEELQDRGYRLKDIAILVRTKKEGEKAANALLEYKGAHPESPYKYEVISDEALFVRNAQSIKLIVSLLKHLWNPSDKTLRTLAVYEYYKTKEQLSESDAIQKHLSTSCVFPEEKSRRMENISRLPLYEMTESLFDLFHDAIDNRENVYIQSFLDMTLEFTVKKSSDLDAFLQWWDETGSGKTVFTPDGQDAIRIMTIHKSKGLGFDVVLTPFCDWHIDHKQPVILWCQPESEPFNRLSLVPVKYSSELKNTIFGYEYFDERLHAFIDNLNVLYVAFTRAKKELIAYLPKPKSKKADSIASVSSLLWKVINNPPVQAEDGKTYLDLSGFFNSETSVFDLGGEYTPESAGKEAGDNEIYVGKLSSIPFDRRLKLKLNNKYAFSSDGRREYGVLLHEIIGKIHTAANMDETLETYCISGDITAAEKQNMRNMLSRFLSRSDVAGWYSGEYRVLNEVEILLPGGRTSRPDRVMIKGGNVVVIDYKFGEKEDRKYLRQVKYYMSQIVKMGYPHVDGYVCYVALNRVEQVK